jgi:Ca2+-binding RTX toxin-like protein
VVNVAPVAFVNGPASGVRGQARTFMLAASDPSAIDEAAGFTYWVNWGDGSSQQLNGPGVLEALHVYAASGTYTVTMVAIDKDGAVSDPTHTAITISAVQFQAGSLTVGGTTASDVISLKVADKNGGVRVTINGSVQGTYNLTGQILVFAQLGTDKVLFETTKFSGKTYYIQDPAVVFGDAGNDTLDARGSEANNILVGGDGNDIIYGGLGRDLLFGGLGADALRGGLGDDVLIGNSTVYDSNIAALNSLMAEWGRTDASYGARANHLAGAPGGHNGDTYLGPQTILNDGAIDQLYGESGLDLFFTTAAGASKDKVNDLGQGEWNIGL